MLEIPVWLFVALILSAFGGAALAILTIAISAVCGVPLELKKDVLNWFKKRKKKK